MNFFDLKIGEKYISGTTPNEKFDKMPHLRGTKTGSRTYVTEDGVHHRCGVEGFNVRRQSSGVDSSAEDEDE